MLIPPSVGLCCAFLPGRRTRIVNILVAALMTLAMWDLGQKTTKLQPVAWTILLVAAAMVIAAISGRQVRRNRLSHHENVMNTHQAIGLILMGGLALTMSHHGRRMLEMPMGHHPNVSGGPDMTSALLGATCLYILATCGVAIHHLKLLAEQNRKGYMPRHRFRYLGDVDAVAMAGSAAIMAMMTIGL
jgi:hypothetical protein